MNLVESFYEEQVIPIGFHKGVAQNDPNQLFYLGPTLCHILRQKGQGCQDIIDELANADPESCQWQADFGENQWGAFNTELYEVDLQTGATIPTQGPIVDPPQFRAHAAGSILFVRVDLNSAGVLMLVHPEPAVIDPGVACAIPRAQYRYAPNRVPRTTLVDNRYNVDEGYRRSFPTGPFGKVFVASLPAHDDYPICAKILKKTVEGQYEPSEFGRTRMFLNAIPNKAVSRELQDRTLFVFKELKNDVCKLVLFEHFDEQLNLNRVFEELNKPQNEALCRTVFQQVLRIMFLLLEAGYTFDTKAPQELLATFVLQKATDTVKLCCFSGVVPLAKSRETEEQDLLRAVGHMCYAATTQRVFSPDGTAESLRGKLSKYLPGHSPEFGSFLQTVLFPASMTQAKAPPSYQTAASYSTDSCLHLNSTYQVQHQGCGLTAALKHPWLESHGVVPPARPFPYPEPSPVSQLGGVTWRDTEDNRNKVAVAE